MKKDDYRTEFEKQRKEIKLNDENSGDQVLSRVDLHSKRRKPKKRSRFSLINTLLILFTLIPIGILIFVIVSWNSPNENITAKTEDSQIQFEMSNKADGKSADVSDEDKDKQAENEAKEREEQERKAKEEREKQEAEQKEKERLAQEKELAAKKEAEAKAKAEREAEARAKAERKAAAQKEAEKNKQNKSSNTENQQSRTHTVAPGETLYRISVNYYKSGDGVSKIMQANGLSSNEISVGQTLVIP